MLSNEEVRKIAKLARLQLADDEIDRLQNIFGTILEFVGTLNEVDTKGVEMMARGIGIENVVRLDEAETRILAPLPEILQGAPQHEGDHIKVKSVFE